MSTRLKSSKQDVTTKVNDAKKKERRTGFLLVAPSLILILVIAIWPVLQSFYFSLFDYRLNEPTKSSIHLDYTLDLERYLNNQPFLVTALDQEIDDAPPEVQGQLQDMKEELTEFDEKLREQDGVAGPYEEVDELLFNFEVPSEDLKFVEIDRSFGEEFDEEFESINEELNTLQAEGVLQQGDKLTGLSNALLQTVVESNFIGLDHYKNSLTEKRMWVSLMNTGVFTVISVGLELVLGMAIALLINKAFFGRGMVRAAILIPWAIPTAVSAKMWSFLYDGQNGIIAKFFADIGIIDQMSTLLTTPFGSMAAVILTDVWKTTPYMALLLLAGLQTIPSSLYEASSIDGASKWKQFTQITLPLLKSSLLVALLFRTLDAFRVFDLIYVLTGGGPANATETISLFSYKVMFGQTNFGEGSALAVIVFICVAIISMIYIKFLGSDLLGDGAKK
ncbi:ABC transporter permease [Pontibacillus chungwhensis BH030062]|uniref:ABC transporter permease n=1 Tax=Pontibacillus chungwhensis BH030062 TaxID=1385513 RepID=A0A0A2VBW5_9BACI|nr:sugar ABC transporter permease [Pontibacillus chungwhensis]KGP91160.1 ABC transporter permease [Pontibacillus chungwhensis BH030062]